MSDRTYSKKQALLRKRIFTRFLKKCRQQGGLKKWRAEQERRRQTREDSVICKQDNNSIISE